MSKYSFGASSKAAEMICHSSLSALSLKPSSLASSEMEADYIPGLTMLLIPPLVDRLPGIPYLYPIRRYQLLGTYRCSLNSTLKMNTPGLFSLMRSHSLSWYFHSNSAFLVSTKKFFIL